MTRISISIFLFLVLSGCAIKAKYPILFRPCEVVYCIDIESDGTWIKAAKKFRSLEEAEKFAKDKKGALIICDNGNVGIGKTTP